MPSQLPPRKKGRVYRARNPTQHEVALARLLLRLFDELAEDDVIVSIPMMDMYNEVKSICEPIVRTVSRETLGDNDGNT